LLNIVPERLRNAQREESKKITAEDKDVSEDYTVIDQYFSSQIAELRQKATQWETLATDVRPGYFENLHKQGLALRDHIASYHHCVPAVLFGKYQAALGQFNEMYAEQKDLAIPKKKF